MRFPAAALGAFQARSLTSSLGRAGVSFAALGAVLRGGAAVLRLPDFMPRRVRFHAVAVVPSLIGGGPVAASGCTGAGPTLPTIEP